MLCFQLFKILFELFHIFFQEHQAEADGQQKLQQINRYAGAVVALIMSIGYYFVIRNMGALKYVSGAVGVFAAVVIIATFVAGAQLIT